MCSAKLWYNAVTIEAPGNFVLSTVEGDVLDESLDEELAELEGFGAATGAPVSAMVKARTYELEIHHR